MKLIQRIFWKVYQVEFKTIDRHLENVQFFRGLAWDVIGMALAEAKRKSNSENLKWAVTNIKRL